MSVRTPWRPLSDLLADATAAELEVSALAQVVYSAVAHYVRYDFGCFAVTDPASGLITWTSKTRSLGVGDEEFAAVEYGSPDLNSFAELVDRDPPVGALSMDTDGHPRKVPASSRADAAQVRVHRRAADGVPQPGRDLGRNGAVPGAG